MAGRRYLEGLRVWLDPVSVHVLQQGAVDVGGPLEVLADKEKTGDTELESALIIYKV